MLGVSTVILWRWRRWWFKYSDTSSKFIYWADLIYYDT
jgi:hypothetical protein